MTADLDPPRFRMNDVTQAAGEALKLLTPEERAATRRQVDIVLQGVIDGLKTLDARRQVEPVEYHMTERGVDAGGYYSVTNGVKAYDDIRAIIEPDIDERKEAYDWLANRDPWVRYGKLKRYSQWRAAVLRGAKMKDLQEVLPPRAKDVTAEEVVAALKLIARARVEHVLDDDGKPVGVYTLDDIARPND